MAINPNSAFVRVTFDIPTPLAIALDNHVRALGQSKKSYLANLIAKTLEPVAPGPTAAKAATPKRRTRT